MPEQFKNDSKGQHGPISQSAPMPNTFYYAKMTALQVASLRHAVIPAGRSFFHITEKATGRVKGFRGCLHQAWALAHALQRR
ncbi:hypothetical protein [Pseudomonas sp. nanlin1]|uniref:hypothetical protein n=1 Tax=Pseudomonas sp. nanlin1 TaxID=3040605 RepID=UPI0038901C72